MRDLDRHLKDGAGPKTAAKRHRGKASMTENDFNEPSISRRFSDLLRADEAFCEKFRQACGIKGRGVMPIVQSEYDHTPNSGTIDIYFEASGQRVLVENKINAGWSYTNDGASQFERYARSAEALNAKTLLLAPQKYLLGARHLENFDSTLSYEAILPVLDEADHALVCAAIERAAVPPENPDPDRTAFFERFEERVRKIAPELAMRTRNRNARSHTVHFNGKKTLVHHPGLPIPSIYLQFVKTGVNLFVREWGKALPAILWHGGHRKAGISLHRTPRGTLGIGMQTAYIDVHGAFSEQIPTVDEAILTTQRLCNWWNENPEVLENWRDTVNP